MNWWIIVWNEETTTFQCGVPYDRIDYRWIIQIIHTLSRNGYWNPWKVISIVQKSSDAYSDCVNKEYITSIEFFLLKRDTTWRSYLHNSNESTWFANPWGNRYNCTAQKCIKAQNIKNLLNIYWTKISSYKAIIQRFNFKLTKHHNCWISIPPLEHRRQEIRATFRTSQREKFASAIET